MTTQLTALPNGWIDRLFERLAAIYGKHWIDMWADVPMADAKDAWAEALRHCDGETLRRGIEYCSLNVKFVPALPEFVSICYSFKTAPEPVKYLPRGDSGPVDDRVREAIRTVLKPSQRDPKQWARDILRDHAAGTYNLYIGVRFAREALGLPVDG